MQKLSASTDSKIRKIFVEHAVKEEKKFVITDCFLVNSLNSSKSHVHVFG